MNLVIPRQSAGNPDWVAAFAGTIGGSPEFGSAAGLTPVRRCDIITRVFTGIVKDIGVVRTCRRKKNLVEFEMSTRLPRLRPSASIALNGCCFTVIRSSPSRFVVQAAKETLRRTTAGVWTTGTTINLERPLRAGGEIGGHFLQGHVDGLGKVERFARTPRGADLVLSLPRPLLRYVAEKGSIGVDGVSLTVNAVRRGRVYLYLIPFTLDHSTLSGLDGGQTVNIETDLLAKYLESLSRRR